MLAGLVWFDRAGVFDRIGVEVIHILCQYLSVRMFVFVGMYCLDRKRMVFWKLGFWYRV